MELKPIAETEVPPSKTTTGGYAKLLKQFLESPENAAILTPNPKEYNKTYDGLLSAAKTLRKKGINITIRAKKPNIYLLKQ